MHRQLRNIFVAVALASFVVPTAFVSPVFAASVKGATLSNVSSDGRKITFMDGGKSVTSKVSASRTEIKIGGKNSDRDNFKNGMKCDINYTADGGKNEPKSISC